MNRGRFLHFTLLAGSLAFAVAVGRPANAAAPGGTPPAGWDAQDIKSTGGSTNVQGSDAAAVWTLTGNGADIQGTADQFQLASTTLPGDGGITARLLTQTGGDPGGWMKSGVMLRDTADPGSLMAAIHYGGVGKNHTSGNVETLYRLAANKAVVGGAAPAADIKAGPIWMRAQRQGQNFQLMSSSNGKDWKIVDQRTVPITAGKPILAGLSSTAHGKPSVVATFDNVSASSDIVQPNILAGPTGLQAFPGNGRVLLTFQGVPNAAGYNIYRRTAGTKDPAALVNAKPTANGWFIDDGASAGLANGTNLIYSVKTVTKSLADPKQLLEGDASGEVLVTPQQPTAGGFVLYHMDTLNPATVTIDNNVLTFVVSGADIWDRTDSGAFFARPVSGDYTITGTVLELPTVVGNTDKFAKAGLMIRTGTQPGQPYDFLFTSAGRDNGVTFEGRRNDRTSTTGATDTVSGGGTNFKNTKFPLTLRLAKVGSVITATQSFDGTNFTPVGTATDYGFLPQVTYAGLGSTAHKDGAHVTSKFAADSIKIQQ